MRRWVDIGVNLGQIFNLLSCMRWVQRKPVLFNYQERYLCAIGENKGNKRGQVWHFPYFTQSWEDKAIKNLYILEDINIVILIKVADPLKY